MKEVQSLYENCWDSKTYPACFSIANNYNAPHFHSALELLYVEQGALTATINGQVHQVEKDSLILVPNYNIHSYATPEASLTTLLVVPLQFIKTFETVFKEKTFVEHVYRGESLPELLHAMKQLNKAIKTPNFHVVKGYVYVILGILTEQVKMEASSPYRSHLEIIDIIQYMEKHFQTPISVKTVARQFGFSESHLSHLFKDHIGCSFPVFLDVIRIKYALTLINDGVVSITEAALEAGFNSLSTFYRTFKRYYDCTPYQYQKQHNQIPKNYTELSAYL